MAEAGVPNFEADQWLGLLAPRGLPRAVVERLVADVNKALASDDLRSGLAKAGMSAAAPGSAAAFSQAFQQDHAKWAEVVKTAGIQAE